MSILNFTGFDVFETGVKGGTGVDKDDPIEVGLIGTPPADWLITYIYAPANKLINSSGVTGLEQHKIGQGSERRNTLVLQAGRNGSSVGTGMARVSTKNLPNVGVLGKEWIYRIGFNLTDFSDPATTPTTGAGIIAMDVNNGGAFNVITRSKDAQGFFYLFNNKQIPTRPVRGQPMHLEVEFGMIAPTNAATFNITLRLYVNGDLFDTAQPWNSSQTTISNWALRWMALSMGDVNAQMTLGVSDIVLSDNVGLSGTDPGRLGPHMVLPIDIDTVVAPDWTLTGPSAKEALSDGNDATYMTSPIAAGTMDLGLNLRLPIGAEVNGLTIYGKMGRDIGAAAPLFVDATSKRASDNGTVSAVSNIALSASPVHRLLADVAKDRVGYNNQLVFSDTGKLNLNLIIKKTGA